jgi:hypothetical protein
MAIFTISKPIDMFTPRVWQGGITSATATTIQINDNLGNAAILGGSFIYSGNIVTGGVVSEYREFTASSQHYAVTGVTLGPPGVLGFLAAGDSLGLMLTAAAGSDRFDGSSGDDRLRGLAGNDDLWGFGGADVLDGGEGLDILRGLFGNDQLDGGSGVDEAYFIGSRNQYTLTPTPTGYTVTDSNAARDGTDTLVGVERIQFFDSRIAVDVNGSGGQAYRLYQASFDRAPDPGGLGYWIGTLDRGAALRDIAQGFLGSAEFTALYGANPTTEQYVTLLYQNVLHRGPDAGGFNFWVGNLNANALSRADTLVQFSESPENQAALIGVMQQGMLYT